MTIKKVHYISGITIALFLALHLFNHINSIFGPERHIELMNTLRHIYRNRIIETILLSAVVVQIISGLTLFKRNLTIATTHFEKLHIWTGLYLAFFLLVHVGMVLVGRLFLHLDTNFYFGVAGLNSFPENIFFIPYYALAILSLFGHIASIHSKKMKNSVLGFSPNKQAIAILWLGVIVTIIIFYGLTGHFRGVVIPEEYKILR